VSLRQAVARVQVVKAGIREQLKTHVRNTSLHRARYTLSHFLPLGCRHCGPSKLVLVILSVLLCGAARPNPVSPEQVQTVRITTCKEGETTHFYVQNDEFCEITMTFEMGLDNLRGTVPFPCTLTLPARTQTEAFCLYPIEEGRKWQYGYTNYYKLGSNNARHDDSCVYQLPYTPGSKFKVTQGYNGKFSHKGSNRYAIDWQMPEGTEVRAARGGVVVRVKDDSNQGGPSLKFDPLNNYVLIRHDDGTLGHYCHLKKGGTKVHVGQTVTTGQVIALSGNTGFSSGPHLHFCVFRAKDGRERESIPVKFTTATDQGITLVSGRTYKASETRIAATELSSSAKVLAPSAGGGSLPP
jgi:hypothetical protein